MLRPQNTEFLTGSQPQTQCPVQTSRPRDSGGGDTRIIVARFGADAVRKLNGPVETADHLAGRSNPDATPAPLATDMLTVYDLDSRACHFIVLHCLEPRPRPAPAVGNVVVFSEPAYAPHRTEKLQLATPGYYRDQGDLAPGIRDQHDGTLTRDGSGWATSIMGGTVSARLSFVSSAEPWVFCASHYRFDSELRNLQSEFDGKCGYTAATRILDPDTFAVWLGVDFALGFDKTTDVSLGPFDQIGYALSTYTTSLWEGARPIDTFVHVYYGPVNYEDMSGSVDNQEQWFDPNAGPVAWFTKKTSFANQNEYRFAVSTLGAPVSPRHYIAVSPELRALTCPV